MCLFFFLACAQKGNNGLLTVPVDVYEDNALLLSEIADNVQAVELEVTDNSLIGNWIEHNRVLLFDKYILFLDGSKNQILLFDHTGRFIRQIGSKGQGPGEFSRIYDISADDTRNYIYILTDQKVISYDFDGNYLREVAYSGYLEYALCVGGDLFFITTTIEVVNKGSYSSKNILYQMNNSMQIVDSVEVRNILLDRYIGMTTTTKHYLTLSGNDKYVYYPVINPYDTAVRDTLYQLKNKELIPYLKMPFNDTYGAREDNRKSKLIYFIYKSSRFVFAQYHLLDEDEMSFFCYDTQKNKGCNMKGGFIDDLYTGEKITIRPFDLNTEKFYYLYTNMDNMVGKDEPNPTLYVGTLKK